MRSIQNEAPISAQQALKHRQSAEQECYKLVRDYRSTILAALRLAMRSGFNKDVCARVEARINWALAERESADADLYLSELKSK